MRIIDRIDELIKKNGLTSKEVAKAISVSPGNITEWRKDRAKPTAEVITRLADYFGVTTDHLLGRSNDIAAASSDTPYSDLPPEAIKELEQYKEFLKQKYGRKKE